jgi:hypothetical protein
VTQVGKDSPVAPVACLSSQVLPVACHSFQVLLVACQLSPVPPVVCLLLQAACQHSPVHHPHNNHQRLNR